MSATAGYMLYLLAGCFALGMLHGVIPDEHTWPITFAYSIGSATGKGGMKAGGFFSLAFTVQRAIMSQLVYFAVAAYLVTREWLNGPIYAVVGAAMAIAGYLILKDKVPHLHPMMSVSKNDLMKHTGRSEEPTVPVHWTIIHGFISGFGVDTGVFTTFVYLAALPALADKGLWMLGWLPGALFGMGTFVVLMVIGFFFGQSLQVARKFGSLRVAAFGRLVGARVLLFGGVAFVIFAPLYSYGVFGLLPLDAGTLMVLLVMVVIAAPVMVYTWREVSRIAVRGALVESG
ncbi:MAG: hypothetical protein QXV32_05105 [Conexivisphaerales archaeon]